MAAKFEPLDEQQKDSKAIPEGASPDVQKAKDAADIQKYETQKIESQRQAVFAENDIKDTADLKSRLADLAEKENKLAKDFMDFDNRKATELSEVQKLKAEHERRLAELIKREQDLSTRTKNVELRERLVQEREDLMNSVEKQKLEDAEKQNSLTERLKKSFAQITSLMSDNVDILDGAGFCSLSVAITDDLDMMRKWAKNDIEKHTSGIVGILIEQVLICNHKAVEMARNPKVYNQSDWDGIVDNLDTCYLLLPEIKPPNLPSDRR